MTDKYMSQARFNKIIANFPQSIIAVVGDFFLDEYLVVDKGLSEISVETGLQAYQISATRKAPGAAGTVTNILRSLDISVVAIGFSGDDGHGFELRRGLKDLNVNINHFCIFPDRFTPTYTKPMLIENGCEIEQSRLDSKNRKPLLVEHEKQLIHALRTAIPEVEAILVVDQVKERNCGTITDNVRAEIADLAEKNPAKIFMVDSREYMNLFRNNIVKFNIDEASKMFGIVNFELTHEFVTDISQRLFESYHMPIILTLGCEGLQVTDKSSSIRIPAIPISGPKDIVGAGDSVLASIGASLSVGASLIEASMIGSLAASIIIQQIGTTGIVTRQQLKERFDKTDDWLNNSIRFSRSKSSLPL